MSEEPSLEGRNYPQWMHFLSAYKLKDELRTERRKMMRRPEGHGQESRV